MIGLCYQSVVYLLTLDNFIDCIMIRQANLLRSLANPSLFPLNRCSNRMVSASVQNDVSLRQIRFGFAKKPVLKKLKAEAPKVQPKT